MKNTETNRTSPAVTLPDEGEEKLGMKWHKLLIYFALFAAAFMNMLNGILNLTGFKYIVNSYLGNAVMLAEQMYVFYPATKITDIAYGIILVAMAVYQIIIRRMLVKGVKKAYVHLNITIGVMCGFTAMYDALFAAFVRNERYVRATINYSSPMTTVWTALVIGSVLIIFNTVYYKKRAGILTK